jgi:hypothetical protein
MWWTVIRNFGRHATPLKIYATNKSILGLTSFLKKQNRTRSDKVLKLICHTQKNGVRRTPRYLIEWLNVYERVFNETARTCKTVQKASGLVKVSKMLQI